MLSISIAAVILALTEKAKQQYLRSLLEEKVREKTVEIEHAQKRILAQEKLASIEKLTSGIAHELNPLNFIINFAWLTK